MTLFLALVVAFVMIGGGAGHLAAPQNFAGFVPAPLPAGPVVLLSGLVEIAIGLAALIPATRARAGLAFALLCLAYTPLHVWDLFRPDPMIAPIWAALARLVLQAGFIWVGVTLWSRLKSR